MAKRARRRQTPAIKLSRWKWIGKGPQNRTLSGEMIGRSKAEVTAELAKQILIFGVSVKKAALAATAASTLTTSWCLRVKWPP